MWRQSSIFREQKWNHTQNNQQQQQIFFPMKMRGNQQIKTDNFFILLRGWLFSLYYHEMYTFSIFF